MQKVYEASVAMNKMLFISAFAWESSSNSISMLY